MENKNNTTPAVAATPAKRYDVNITKVPGGELYQAVITVNGDDLQELHSVLGKYELMLKFTKAAPIVNALIKAIGGLKRVSK